MSIKKRIVSSCVRALAALSSELHSVTGLVHVDSLVSVLKKYIRLVFGSIAVFQSDADAESEEVGAALCDKLRGPFIIVDSGCSINYAVHQMKVHE